MAAIVRVRARDAEDATDTSEDMRVTQETRRRVEGLHLAPVVDREVVWQHAQW